MVRVHPKDQAGAGKGQRLGGAGGNGGFQSSAYGLFGVPHQKIGKLLAPQSVKKEARGGLGPEEEVTPGKEVIASLNFSPGFILIQEKVGGMGRDNLFELNQPAVEGIFLADGFPPGMGPQPPGYIS